MQKLVPRTVTSVKNNIIIIIKIHNVTVLLHRFLFRESFQTTKLSLSDCTHPPVDKITCVAVGLVVLLFMIFCSHMYDSLEKFP